MTDKMLELQKKISQDIRELDNSIRKAAMRGDYRQLDINNPAETAGEETPEEENGSEE